jgi:hypothetical protein
MWRAYTKNDRYFIGFVSGHFLKNSHTCRLSNDTTNGHSLRTRSPFGVIFGKPTTTTLTHLTVVACLKTIGPLYNNNNQPKQQQVCTVVLK